METFSRYESVSLLNKDIEKHILSNSRDEVTLMIKKPKYVGGISFFKNDEESKISSDMFCHGKFGQTEIDAFCSAPSTFCGSLRQVLWDKRCELILNFSTKKVSKAQIRRNGYLPLPTFDNCIASLGGTIKSSSVSTSFALGISHDKSISTLCAFKSQQVEATLVGSVTEDNARLTASGIHRSGALFCFSADLAQLSAHELHFGAIRNLYKTYIDTEIVKVGKKEHKELVERKKKFGTVFGAADILNKRLEVGGTYSFKLGTVAAKIVATNESKPSVELGVILSRAAKCTLMIKENGTINMESVLSPRDWLNVRLRSETSAMTSFNPVNFGWSLDINL